MPKKLCHQPPRARRTFSPGIHPERKRIIIVNSTQWANGTEIKYMFLEGVKKQQDVVREAFRKWEKLGIGISFTEVKSPEESMVRIGFDPKDDSWSEVGRDVLTVKGKKPTMNFAIDLTGDEGMSTALHEIGHTLGFDHEHQSPFAGITWDANAVYKSLGGDPNYWSKASTKAQILDKLPRRKVSGTKWDPDSIMHYEFDPGLILKPVKYRDGIFPPGKLSPDDIRRVKSVYPPVKSSSYKKIGYNKPLKFKTKSGGQIDFIFTAPYTRSYTFETKGNLDTVMVVSELEGKKKYYMAGDDDSGFDKNSKITLPLVKGREYLVNIKVTYARENAAGTLLVS